MRFLAAHETMDLPDFFYFLSIFLAYFKIQVGPFLFMLPSFAPRINPQDWAYLIHNLGGKKISTKKKTKYMAKGGMKKTKYMAKGGMKKTKYMAKGGAARRK